MKDIEISNPILIGRHKETEILKECLSSPRSEFVIVCGRRRVGKTYLVDHFFQGTYDFTFVGKHNTKTKQQLAYFAKELERHNGKKYSGFKNWYDAFDALEAHLEQVSGNRKKVIFIDEMPWIDRQRSTFVSALENFWNGWANRRHDILLVASGSATSWMANNLIENKGGLHNRITRRLYLEPFTLSETEEYFSSFGCQLERYDILQFYMLTGGVPFYLSMLDPKQSVAQNIDNLCFTKNAPLKTEYHELYNALFKRADTYIQVVELLYRHKKGLTRKEISKALSLNGKYLTTVLTNLQQCDFIESYGNYGKKGSTVYRLVDFYSQFYLKFLKGNTTKDHKWWSHNLDDTGIRAWQGLTYELICLRHHREIKKALGISGIGTEISTWRCAPDEEKGLPGAQIDMLIQRKDRITHLCEIKHSEQEYYITKEYAMKLRSRSGIFKAHTGTKETLVHTFITTFGVGEGIHKSLVHSEVTLDDLFD